MAVRIASSHDQPIFKHVLGSSSLHRVTLNRMPKNKLLMRIMNPCLLALMWLLGCVSLSAQENKAAKASTDSAPASSDAAKAQAPANATTSAAPAPAPANTAGATSVANTTASTNAAEAKPANGPIRFQFDGIAYSDVLARFAQMANKPLITDTPLEGTLTFNDPRPYTYAEALDTLNLILSMKGVMLVESDRFLRLVPLKELPQMSLRIFRGLDKTGDVKPGEVITVVFSLQNLESTDIAQAISSMLSNAGSIAPLSRGRGLIITDRLANIRRIKDLLTEIDTAAPTQRQMRTYTLLHASGAVVADLINKTFGSATAPKRVEFNPSSKQYVPLPPDPNDYVTAVYDEASRTLVMYGPTERITLAEGLIKRFEDQNSSRVGEVRIFYPRAISAQELARMVREAIPGVAEEKEAAHTAATKAKVIVDPPTNRLIVSAPAAGQLDAIEKLINKIDSSTEGQKLTTRSEDVQVTKIFRCRWADPDTLARLLSDALVRPGYRPRNIPQFKVTVDPRTKDLILMGIPGDVEQATDIATQLDSNQPAQRILRMIPVKSSRPTEMAPKLRQVYQDQIKNQPGVGVAEAVIMGDDFNGRLIVTATETQLSLIEELTKKLDTDQPAQRTLRAFTLKSNRPTDFAQKIRSLYQEQVKNQPGAAASEPLIMGDDVAGRLLVTATESQLKAIEDLVKQLDEDTDHPTRQLKAITLKHASAASVATMVSQLFSRLADDPARRVIVTASVDDQTLMVEARDATLNRIDEVVRSLDLEPARGTLELRTYHLVEANAAELAPTLSRLLAERQDPRRRATDLPPQPRFEADTTANVLMVAATKEQLQQIDALIKELHTPTEVASDIRTFKLQYSDAAQMVQLLETMLREETTGLPNRGSRGNLQRGPGGEYSRLRIAAAPVLNSIVIQGSPQRIALAEQLIRSLDRLETINSSVIQTVHLQKAQAEMVAEALNKAMSARAPRNGPKRANVTPVLNANSVIIEGSIDDVKEVMQLIKGLDEESSSGKIEVHIYKLENGSAKEISRVLSQILQGMSRRQPRSGRPSRDINVTEDDRTNSLIVSGTADDFKLVQQILPTLDQRPDHPDRDVSFVYLKNADAFDVSMKIESLYAGRAKGEQVVVDPDSTANSVTIMAKRADMAEIEEMIKRLDGSAIDTTLQVRMETLEKVPAEQMAKMLLSLYPQIYQREIKVVEKIPVRPAETTPQKPVDRSQSPTNAPPNKTAEEPAPPVVMAVDKNANVLVFSGPARELKQIHTIIFDLSRSFVSNDAEFRQFPLKEADPVAVTRTLNELFRQDAIPAAAAAAMQRGQNQRQPPPQPPPGQPGQLVIPPPKIVVVAEPRTRSIIARARPTDFPLLESLIKQLDVPGVSSQIEFRLVTLKNVQADKMLPLVNQVVTQLNLSRPTDPLNVIKDPRGGALFVVARSTLLDQVEKMIQELDSPAGVAETEVVVIPLKNARAPQLAAILQEMLKPGVKGDTSTEARELQEQVRRLKVQNDQGEAVLLDLNKPIKIMADPLQAGPGGSNRLILASTSDNLKALSHVVAMMDTVSAEGPVTAVKVFRLKYASATRLAPLLQSVFAQSGPAPAADGLRTQVSRLQTALGLRPPKTTELPQRWPAVILQPDDTANILLVAARSDILPLIEDVVNTLDIPAASGLSTIRIYPLQHADAPTLQRLINDLYHGPNSTQVRKEDRPNVTVDDRTNALIVSGNENAFAIIASLLDRLDKDLPQGAQIRLVPLKHSTASTLSAALTTLFNQRYQATRSPDAQRNRPIIIPDSRSNSLMIAANVEDNRSLDLLLEKLDREPENPSVSISVIGLRHNDSGKVATMIANVFTARRQGMAVSGQPPAPQDQVHVEADSLSNALVISANKENLDLIRGLLAKIDVEPTAMEGLIQTFTLKQADAQRAAAMLRSLIDQGIYRPGVVATGGRGRSGREAIAVTVDQRSNTLIVSASPENLLVVKELIKQLDSQTNADFGNIQLYTLKHAKASQLGTVLEQFFRSKRAGETTSGTPDRSVPVTVTADDRTNTLLVTGGKEIFEAIDRMIAQLDSKEIVAKTSFQVFPLKQATAAKLQSTLTQLFAKRPSTVQGQPPEPITVVADSWANALVIGAAPEDLVMVESLIAQLDSDKGDAGIEVQVIQLAKADARRVAQTVQGLYRTGGTGTASPVTVNVDERLNALVVSAGQSDVKRIIELVKKLDTDQVANVSEIRIFPLNNARAIQLAAILTSILNSKPAALTEQSLNRQSLLQFIARTPEGRELVASALKEGVLITPDPRTNSLIVSAPVDYMTLLENLISRLDTSSPQMAKIHVFNLKNADARQMATILMTLFRLQRTGTQAINDRTVQYTLVKPAAGETPEPEVPAEEGATATFGTAEENTLSVTVDLRTNSLLVGGTDHYVTLASELINTLDASPAQERQSEVYRLKNSRSRDVETALKTFLKQDQQLLSVAVGQQAMAQEMMEREVAIVAETNSNTLLVSASHRYFTQVKSLIEQLDQPQLQVLIQVLLAEVTLDSTSELGVDWSYHSMGSPQFSTGDSLGATDALKNFGGFSSGVSGSNFSFLLRALQSEGRLQVLSRPQILTADNQEATVNVGQKVPLITDARVTQFGDSINSVSYTNVGVELKVVPRISPDGFVKMDVGPRISQLTSSDVDLGRGAKAPIINERSATTTVSVQSGQSILIGGLISTSDDKRSSQMPLLGKIPYLGALFRSHKRTESRTELLIILTPQVLVKGEDISKSLDAKSITREQLDRSTINEGINNDPLQRQMLDPLYPDRKTNSPPVKPPRKL